MRRDRAQMVAGGLVLVACFLVLLLNAEAQDEPSETALALVIPSEPGTFGPSFMLAAEGESLDSAQLTETEECARCHESIVAEWRTSSHAFASFNNPFYRMPVDRLRDAVSFEASLHCGGCHDPALIPDGAMLSEVAPDDARAHVGVSCTTCHGIESVSNDGNGSYVLTTRPIPVPASDDDAAGLARHRERVALPPQDSPAMCITCHRAFLNPATGNDHYLIGQDDASAWAGSGFANNPIVRIDDVVEPQTCANCHMPEVDGHASHRFPGSHTALAAGLGDDEALASHVEILQTAATIDIAAARHDDGSMTLPADGAPVLPGSTLELDVVVRNVGAGHTFPAGTLDAQDTWIEVRVQTRHGRDVAEAGTRQAGPIDDPLSDTTDDPTAHIFRVEVVDEQGLPIRVHNTWEMRTAAWNHTIPTRDAAVVRYRFEVPEALTADDLPLRIEATLRHRRHRRAFQADACSMSSDARGQALSTASLELSGVSLDPCIPQPITELAQSVAWLGGPPPDGAVNTRPAWRRLHEHALGLLHNVQERLDEARPSLSRAWEEVSRVGTAREQAMVLYVLAALEGKQGRTDIALELLDQIEALLPNNPATDFRRGLALAQVWRWDEAAAAFGEVVQAVPGADLAWQWYSRSLGSALRDVEALEAAQTGLLLQPRDSSMLLTQAVALAHLEGTPQADIDAARDAYAEHRPYDLAAGLKLLCFRAVEDCAGRRMPVPIYSLRIVGE